MAECPDERIDFKREKGLLAAIIHRGMMDAIGSTSEKEQYWVRDARAWMFRADTKCKHSFENICLELNFSPKKIRKWVLAQINKSNAEKKYLPN